MTRAHGASADMSASPEQVWSILIDGSGWPTWDSGGRTYSLAAANGGATGFHMQEEYGGPLLGVVGRSIPDLAPSFMAFANGLKRRAEAG